MTRVAILLALVASAASAEPMKPPAREHFERGLALYKRGDYTRAIGELERGRQLDPHPHFEYALGQALRRLGDCKNAVQHYIAFLDTHPPEPEAVAVRKNIARCPIPSPPAQSEAIVAAPEPRLIEIQPSEPQSTPPPPPALAPAAPTAPPAPTPDRDTSPPLHWYTDVPGGILTGAGLGGLAVGVTYLVLADRDIAAANAAKPIARFQELAAAGHDERTFGTIATVAGSALVVGAVVRYVVVGRDAPDPVVSIAVDRSGAYAVWSGRF